MLGVGVVLFGILTWGLDVYTHHGENVAIPEVRGKSLGEASRQLEAVDLRYEVIDSIYDKGAIPGTIQETIPAPGARVKPGRLIFVTIYASSPRKLVLPHIEGMNMSGRQVVAMLRGLGFEQLETRIVAGEHRDLCVGITDTQGRPLKGGTALAKDTKLVLLITGQVRDSLSIDDLLRDIEADWNSEPAPPQPDTTTKTEPENWW